MAESIYTYYADKIKSNKSAFLNKVDAISKKLDINPIWLLAVMNSESGLNSTAVNPTGGATGLIQFMPSTARGLGTTTEALKNMSNVQQLDYVYKYFSQYVSKLNSYIDLYMVTFFPVAAGKPDNFVLEAKNISKGIIAKQNPVFDLDKNGSITVGEVKRAFLKRIPEEYRSEFSKAVSGTLRFAKRNLPMLILSAVVLSGLAWYAISNQGQAVKAINKLA